MRLRVAQTVVIGIVLMLTVMIVPSSNEPVSASSPRQFSVMTRNLYLGADIVKALQENPGFSAAAQAMWDQVAATNFTARVDALSSEIVENRPAVLGLQEATVWQCLDAAGTAVTIYDFTTQLLDHLREVGSPYVIAEANGTKAFSPGFAIAPIPGITVVNDPRNLQPKVGLDSSACGMQIADVLAVRADLAPAVTTVGTKNFAATTMMGGILEVRRGYAWADIGIDDETIRFTTTHLESLWTRDAAPASAAQARELIADLGTVTTPVVAMGDFNIDPRDPRPVGAPNPGGQPEVTPTCPDRSCSAYWAMVDAGYIDAGPDSSDPRNATWGLEGSLAGPDPARLDAALAAGNDLGFTDRLDYVFVRGDISIVSSALIGRSWPDGAATWECNDRTQVANRNAVASRMNLPQATTARCGATDHLGILATLALPSAASSGFPWGIVAGVAVLLIVAAALIVVTVRRRSHRIPSGS